MPIFGLPKMLETILNDLVQVSSLVSYKLAGNGDLSTVVIRFDNKVNTGSVKPTHQSTPDIKCYCRKSPSQIRRDKARKSQYQTNMQQERTKTNFMDFDEKRCMDLTDRKKENTIQFDSLISESSFDPMTRNVSQPAAMLSENKTTHQTDCIGHTEHQVKNKHTRPSSIDKVTSPAHFSKSLEENVNKQLSDEMCKPDREKTVSVIKHQRNSIEGKGSTPRSRYTSISSDSSPSAISHSSQHRTRSPSSNSSSDSDGSQEERKCISYSDVLKQQQVITKLQENVSIRRFIINLDKETAKRILKEDRNNEITKASNDEFENESKIFVETDDFIIMYDSTIKEVQRIAIKGYKNHYSRSLELYMFECPDESPMIQQKYSNDWENIITAIPHLKNLAKEILED